jgi:acyl-CoA thioester hydrolase
MPAYVHVVPLRWGDFDPLQHVNNVRFFEFMQDARVGMLESKGISRTYLAVLGQFVAHNEIDYLLPIPLEVTEVQIRIWVNKVGGASYDLAYEFIGPEGQIYAKAKTVMVTVDMKTQNVVRIPAEMREMFATLTL